MEHCRGAASAAEEAPPATLLPGRLDQRISEQFGLGFEEFSRPRGVIDVVVISGVEFVIVRRRSGALCLRASVCPVTTVFGRDVVGLPLRRAFVSEPEGLRVALSLLHRLLASGRYMQSKHDIGDGAVRR